MKSKKLVLLFIIVFIAFYGKAQIAIDCTNERVGIGFGLTSPTDDVHVKGDMYIDGDIRIIPRPNFFIDIKDSYYGWSLITSHSSSGYLGYGYKLYGVNAEYIWCDNLTESDRNLKKNIVPLYDALPLIKKLRPVTFDYNRDRSKTDDISLRNELEANDKNRLGFIAQDVQQILPQSVLTKEPDATLCIRMDDFIPLLVKGMQEQQTQIDSLITVINNLKSPENTIKSAQIGGIDENSDNEAKLYQNNPNPFTEQTTINCFIPTSSNNARLLVFNMQGTLVKSFTVSGRNETSVTIAGAELNAGMYIYSLIIDNKEIDSKRMILSN